ncbi:uncharacterized protein TNCV_1946411 [Trichonephila clavipes]|uniref:Uncharacterized protein n=1 Tax=Trichonephila clavipes TaxID=2585209 RepID=A0A8X6SD90_TRICX|nr:uncharacterized protein TNCV_1946411 [Trichonephila clavipes]
MGHSERSGGPHAARGLQAEYCWTREKGNVLQYPSPVVSATTYRTFGLTDLTNSYSVSTRRVIYVYHARKTACFLQQTIRRAIFQLRNCCCSATLIRRGESDGARVFNRQCISAEWPINLENSEFEDYPTPTIVERQRSMKKSTAGRFLQNPLRITGLSPSVASTVTEHGKTVVFLWSENANQPGVKNLASEVLTKSERIATMRKKTALQVVRSDYGEPIQLPQWDVTTQYSHKGKVMLEKGYDTHLNREEGNISVVFTLYSDLASILSPDQIQK